MKIRKNIALLAVLCCVAVSVTAQGPYSMWGVATYGGAGAGVVYRTNENGNNQVSTALPLVPAVSGCASRQGQLTEANGLLYGVGGGSNFTDPGMIYSFDPFTGVYTVLASFNGSNGSVPESGLIRADNGLFYGVTSRGGSANKGTFYEFNAVTNTITVRKHFTGLNGRAPFARPVQASNGKIYGTTSHGGQNDDGVIYEFDPATNVFTLKMYFEYWYSGSSSLSGLVAANGKLYGVASEGGAYYSGVLFEYNFTSNIFAKKLNFNGTNGAYPYGSMELNTDGILVGMTERGGANDNGVIFEYNPVANIYTRTFDFDYYTSGAYPRGQLILASDGLMYGMTSDGWVLNGGGGVLFSYDPVTNGYHFKHKLHEVIRTSLLEGSDGQLYGFSSIGTYLGDGPGFIFSYDITSDQLVRRVDFEFSSAPEGNFPMGAVVAGSNGKLYTTFADGGAFGHGSLVEIDPSFNGGSINKLMDFRDTITGSGPGGVLLQHSNGKLYGTTRSGGAYLGVLFEYDVTTDSFISKHQFGLGVDGYLPVGEIAEGPGGKIYGVTGWGGTSEKGVLYEFDPSADVYTKLLDFDSATGFNPEGGVTLHSNGKLYGTLRYATYPAGGSVYEYDITTNTLTVLHTFLTVDGRFPESTLTEAPNGKLYGTALQGGLYNKGVIFEIDPVTGMYTKTYDFTGGAGGAAPKGSLTLSPNGKLYGTVASGGALNAGFLYEYDYTTHTLTSQFDFTGPNGFNSYGGRMAITCESVDNTPQPDVALLCVGESLNLSAGTTSPLYSYQWYCNNAPISGATAPTYSVASVVLADAGNYSCHISNACRTSNVDTRVRIDSARVTAPVPGPISGTNDVCPIAGTMQVATYSVPPASGIAVHNWVVPAGTTLLSGQGTDTIIVRFPDTYTTGTVKVQAVYHCGTTSAFSALTVSKVPPAVPSTINGPKSNLCPGTNYTYTVPPVAGATLYTWITPPNSSVVSGQGTNALTVTYTGAYVYGALSVKPSNGCATSALYTVTTFMKPPTPGAITGNKNVCANLGGAPQTYSVPAIAGITNYIWTIPAGCTLVSGQGTTSISVAYPVGFTTGTISVVADGTCYNSTASTVAVTAGPPQPGGITGDATVCSQITAQTAVNYSIVAVTGATSYNWIVPAGATILSGQGTRFASIRYDSTLVSGTQIKVAAVNSCITGLYRALVITGCPSSARSAQEEMVDTVSAITIYPNPASDVLNINVPSDCTAETDIELYDVNGNLIRSERRVISEGSNTLSIDINDLASGLYFVRVASLSGEAGEMKPFIKTE